MSDRGQGLFRAARRRGSRACAIAAEDPSAAAAHRKLQRGYIERASVGERQAQQADPIG